MATFPSHSHSDVWRRSGELYSFLGLDVPEHVDVFGTKFFPMWPGGGVGGWQKPPRFWEDHL
jgi:hypothetical protein